MEYILRKATQEDASPIRALIHRVHINPRDLDWRRFWVAVDREGHLLGCGQIKPHADGTFELASIAVQPQYQGQGIGRALIQQLLSEGPRPLYLMCRAPLETYYEQFGFRAALPAEVTPSFRFVWRLFSILKALFPVRWQGRIMVKHT